MYEHEEHVRTSNVRKSAKEEEVDRFGVCWGAELLDGREEEEPKNKSIRQFSSFYLHGRKYGVDDTVYLLSGDRHGTPYIGRIGRLYENVKDKEKQMHVRWFCRPCEMPEGLPDVDYSENCKEVFVMWGNCAKNINNPASTLRHCSVLCTAEEDWNKNVPSIEEIAAADHTFDRAYDLRTGKLRSLDSIVKHYGEHLVTGTGRRTRAPGKSRKMTPGIRPPLDHQPLPLAMRASSHLPSLELAWHRSELAGLPALVTSPNTPSPIDPVEGHTESFVPKLSVSGLKTASHDSNKVRLAHSKGAEDRMIPNAAKQGSKRTLVKNAATLDSQKRPRVDRSDSSLPQQGRVRLDGSDLPSPGFSHGRNNSSIDSTGAGPYGNAVLNRERQKSTLRVAGKQTSSEDKKRSRANSLDQLTEKGKLKKPKLSVPFHAPGVALTKKVSKVESNVSLSIPTGPKMGELRSPKVPERNLPENSVECHQARQSLSIKKRDVRVASAPVAARCLAKDEKSSNRDHMGNQFQISPRSVGVENAELLSPKDGNTSTTLSGKRHSDPKLETIHRVKKQSITGANVGLSDREERHCLQMQSSKEKIVNISPSSRHSTPMCLSDASRHQEAPENISPKHQNGASLKCTDLELDTKLFGKSSAHGRERRYQSSMKDDVNEVNPKLPKGQKGSSSNHVLTDGDVSPTSNTNLRPSEGNWNGMKESRVKHESFLSSKRSGSSLEGSRCSEVGSPHIASKERPGSELGVGTLKSKIMKHSEPQPIETDTQQVHEELKVKKIGLVAKGVPRVSSKKQSDQTKLAETSRLPPQGLAKRVAKVPVKNHKISEPGLAARKENPPAGLDTTVAPPEEKGRETFQPKKKIFNFPWEDTLRIALEQGKALFLQNLDPWFSSAEMETDLQELLRVSCDVRILPPKNFTCYTSGQALVLFHSHGAAKDALQKFTDNLLIWSKDERPVLASLADATTAVGSRIHGFYHAELSSSRGVHPAGEDQYLRDQLSLVWNREYGICLWSFTAEAESFERVIPLIAGKMLWQLHTAHNRIQWSMRWVYNGAYSRIGTQRHGLLQPRIKRLQSIIQNTKASRKNRD